MFCSFFFHSFAPLEWMVVVFFSFVFWWVALYKLTRWIWFLFFFFPLLFLLFFFFINVGLPSSFSHLVTSVLYLSSWSVLVAIAVLCKTLVFLPSFIRHGMACYIFHLRGFIFFPPDLIHSCIYHVISMTFKLTAVIIN